MERHIRYIFQIFSKILSCLYRTIKKYCYVVVLRFYLCLAIQNIMIKQFEMYKQHTMMN